MSEEQELAIRGLENLKGDNLALAKHAFRNCTIDQMNMQYGASGKTRAEILAEYESHEAKVQRAIEWVKSK